LVTNNLDILTKVIPFFITAQKGVKGSPGTLTIRFYHMKSKQNSWFCKEIREDNFRFWWRRIHEDASQGMYMSKIEIFFFTA
jgi:hypothetical protein